MLPWLAPVEEEADCLVFNFGRNNAVANLKLGLIYGPSWRLPRERFSPLADNSQILNHAVGLVNRREIPHQ